MKTRKCKHLEGFTLIEVLVTLIVISVGLLGIASLQARSQQAQLEAYQRSQGMVLLQDMANRINANRGQADRYVITTNADGTPFLGVDVDVDTLPDTANTVANEDLAAWDAALKGVAEVLNDQNVGAMIGARGCIAAAGADQYRITVAWQGLSETVAPTDSCASTLYGDDARRRVVNTVVQIGDLRSLAPLAPLVP